jgi:hypothetical protein
MKLASGRLVRLPFRVYRGRTGFDRMLGSESGVPWLISWPRKKLITMLVAESNLSLAA